MQKKVDAAVVLATGSAWAWNDVVTNINTVLSMVSLLLAVTLGALRLRDYFKNEKEDK